MTGLPWQILGSIVRHSFIMSEVCSVHRDFQVCILENGLDWRLDPTSHKATMGIKRPTVPTPDLAWRRDPTSSRSAGLRRVNCLRHGSRHELLDCAGLGEFFCGPFRGRGRRSARWDCRGRRAGWCTSCLRFCGRARRDTAVGCSGRRWYGDRQNANSRQIATPHGGAWIETLSAVDLI